MLYAQQDFDNLKAFIKEYDFSLELTSKNGIPISLVGLKYLGYEREDLILICGSSPLLGDCIFWKKVGTMQWSVTYKKHTKYNISLGEGVDFLRKAI
jgi:hypothetical protein